MAKKAAAKRSSPKKSPSKRKSPGKRKLSAYNIHIQKDLPKVKALYPHLKHTDAFKMAAARYGNPDATLKSAGVPLK